MSISYLAEGMALLMKKLRRIMLWNIGTKESHEPEVRNEKVVRRFGCRNENDIAMRPSLKFLFAIGTVSLFLLVTTINNDDFATDYLPTSPRKKKHAIKLRRTQQETIRPCKKSSKNPEQIFNFIHVFKTAGSTVRSLLDQVATSYKCGSSLLVGCAGQNGFTDDDTCVVKTHQRRGFKFSSKDKDKDKDSLNRNSELQKYVRSSTFIYGHMKDGVAAHLQMDIDESDIFKMTFIRDPIERWISAALYSRQVQHIRANTKEVDDEELFEIIKGKSLEVQPTFNIYPMYILTLEELALHEEGAEQAELTIKKLKAFSMVGVVERWEESLDFLSTILNTKGAKAIIERFKTKASNSYQKIRESQGGGTSRSTSSWVKLLQSDAPDHYNQLKESLKYEYMVYDAGMEIFKEKQKKKILSI